jgi:ribonuclease VapC
MFVDASAIAAILLEEADAAMLADRLENARSDGCVTSPLGVFEATLAIARNHKGDVARARAVVLAFLQDAGVRVVPINEETAGRAIDAHERFGKGRHRARLNFGDCFAYAMARQHGVPLLYKGDDFALTDLA